MQFELILPRLREGSLVRRKAWADNVCLAMQVPSLINKEIVPKMTSLPSRAKKFICKSGNGDIFYSNQVLKLVVSDGKATMATSSVLSFDDILAADWEVYEEY